VSDEDFARFIEAVPGHVLVVVDTAYEEFVDDEGRVDGLKYFDGIRPLVVLRTFSKMYALAGVRGGYGFAPVSLVEALDKVREPFTVNSVVQAGALASLADEAELEKRRDLNRQGKERLYKCFEELGLSYLRSEANFVWVVVPDPSATFDALLQRGIIVRPFPSGLRIGVGDKAGVGATIAAFKQIFD